jgi:hypothetical protein
MSADSNQEETIWHLALRWLVVLTFSLMIAISLSAIPASARHNVGKCVPASKLKLGTRAGVIRAATRQEPHFQLRVAERAGQRDLNYQLLAATCSKAMVRLAWYTDLHPPGMQCSACDSHEYRVLLRHGGWATLGYFGG